MPIAVRYVEAEEACTRRSHFGPNYWSHCSFIFFVTNPGMFHEHTWIGYRPPAISAGSWPPEAITIQWPWATTLWPYPPHALHSWIGYRPLQAFTDRPHSITIQWPWITTTWWWPPAPSSPPPVVNPPPPPPPLPASTASATAVDLIAITEHIFAGRGESERGGEGKTERTAAHTCHDKGPEHQYDGESEIAEPWKIAQAIHRCSGFGASEKYERVPRKGRVGEECSDEVPADKENENRDVSL